METFQIRKRANLERFSLDNQQKEKLQELFMRHQQIFSRNSDDLGYCDKNKLQIKLNIDAQPFRGNYCSMSFDKRKAMKTIVEDLEDAKLIEPIRIGSIINIGKKERWQRQTSCRLQRFEQTNREN